MGLGKLAVRLHGFLDGSQSFVPPTQVGQLDGLVVQRSGEIRARRRCTSVMSGVSAVGRGAGCSSTRRCDPDCDRPRLNLHGLRMTDQTLSAAAYGCVERFAAAGMSDCSMREAVESGFGLGARLMAASSVMSWDDLDLRDPYAGPHPVLRTRTFTDTSSKRAVCAGVACRHAVSASS